MNLFYGGKVGDNEQRSKNRLGRNSDRFAPRNLLLSTGKYFNQNKNAFGFFYNLILGTKFLESLIYFSLFSESKKTQGHREVPVAILGGLARVPNS